MRHDVDLVLDEPGHPASFRVHFPGMAFDVLGLVGGIHFDLQGTRVRFNASFADSAFQVPFFRGQGADKVATYFTESLLFVTSTSLGDKLLVLSAAENHFHLDYPSTSRSSGFTRPYLPWVCATPGPDHKEVIVRALDL